MESHRQRGHSMFKNMRTNHLQVWHKVYHGINGIKSQNGMFSNVCTCLICSLCFCIPVTSQWVGASELQVAASGGRAAEGESCVRPWPRGAAEPKLGARCCCRTQSNQMPHPQKGSNTVQTGTALQCGHGSADFLIKYFTIFMFFNSCWDRCVWV